MRAVQSCACVSQRHSKSLFTRCTSHINFVASYHDFFYLFAMAGTHREHLDDATVSFLELSETLKS